MQILRIVFVATLLGWLIGKPLHVIASLPRKRSLGHGIAVYFSIISRYTASFTAELYSSIVPFLTAIAITVRKLQ